MPLPAAAVVVSAIASVGSIVAGAAKSATKAISKSVDGPSAASLDPLVDTMATNMPFSGFRHELAKNAGMRVRINLKTNDADTFLDRIGEVTGEFERNDMRTHLTRDLVDRKMAGLN